ncbi:hypothetical protein RHMOL_Rhmol09G0214800 [Rhododendron molle]|uniref:Uncharacterized protein n=1 Tax=Rhododendron molle TaxID=49168 RepID=A0ACC0MFT8_RHOML|nr:hypothetical protein RHMOL_Rhmol09G0214800 [Rhododendron molle]
MASESSVSPVGVSVGDETLVEDFAFEGGMEGGLGGEEEVMVEVVGSDVFVDGVGGHGVAGDWNGEVGGGVLAEEGLERKTESREGEGVGDLEGHVLDSDTETRAEVLEGTVGSLGEQTHVVAAEEVSMRVSEEGGSERGDPLVGGNGDATEASALDSKAQNSEIETGLGVTLANSAQVVVAEEVGVGEEILERELVDEGVKRSMNAVEEGGGALDQVELVTERGGASNDGLWNPEIEDAVVCSSVGLESSSLQTPIVDDGVDAAADKEALKYKDEVPVVHAEEGHSNDPENNHSQVTDKEGTILDSAELSYQQVEGATGGNVGVMNEEKILLAEGSSDNQQIKAGTAEEKDVTDGKVYLRPDIGAPESGVVGEIGVDAGEVDTLCADSGSCIVQAEVAADCSVIGESKISISSTVIQAGGQGEPLTAENGVLSTSDENVYYAEDQQLKVENVSGGSEREIAVCTESHSSYEQTKVVSGNEASGTESSVSNYEVKIPVTDDTVATVACSDDHQSMECENACGIAEFSNEQAFVAETEEVAVMDFEEVANIEGEVPMVEVLNENTYTGKDEELNTLTVGGSMGKEGHVQGNAEAEASVEPNEIDKKEESSIVDCQGIVQVPASCPLVDNILLSEKDEDLKVDTLGKSTVEDTSAGVDSPQIGDHGTSIPTRSGSLEDEISLRDGKQETIPHLADIPTLEEDGDQSMNMLIVDEKLTQLIGDDTQAVEGNVGFVFSECVDGSATGDLYLDDSSTRQDVEVQEHYTSAALLNQNEGLEVEMGEDGQNVEDKSSRRSTLRSRTSGKVHQGNYLLVPENEGEFSLSDLVWGKVKSHPWWPGQIFDSADASEEAMKYHKKGCFLVAYFGDRTFAWNEPSLLKPFWSNFSQIEKQSNSEAFQSAVSCALDEVSRRIELGLACSCLQKDTYDNIECQVFENTGVRQESSRRNGVDKSTGVSSFQPAKLLGYVRALARSPFGEANRLDLVVAKAQLLAVNRLKGYYRLPRLQFCGGFSEKNANNPHLGESIDHSLSDDQIHSFKGRMKIGNSSSHKRKHNLKDIQYPSKKEKKLSELIADIESPSDGENESDLKASSKLVSSSSDKKRKSVDFLSDGSDVQDRPAKVSTAVSSIPKPSFKIGEYIRRAASQLTGPPSIVKCNGEKVQKVEDGSSEVPDNSQSGRINFTTDCSSLDEMLSQLNLKAKDPMKGYGLPTTIISFFTGFRNSISLGRYSGKQNSFLGRVGGGRKKKTHGVGHSEEFEFDDVNDSYWTDMSIQNNLEEQPSGDNKNREGEYQLVAFDPNKPHKSSRRAYSRKKRFSNANYEPETEEANTYIDKVKQDMSPAELLLNFSEGDPVPSVLNLGRTFRRFGPLKESETEVDVETGRARVVFKRGSDAQVALSSAGTFNIFGPVAVNYQLNYTPSKLNYTPSISFETFPLATAQGLEDAT